MNSPIRILHVFGRLDRGGSESMIMNLYRNIDRNKIQFDFVKHTEEKCSYESEIKKLGGEIYAVPRYTLKNHSKYVAAWRVFFKRHPNYKIVHGHIRSTASIYLKVAKDHKKIAIAHSHSISNGSGFFAIIKNALQYPIKYIADYFLAPTVKSGEWLFGKNVTQQDNFFILKNAINSTNYIVNPSIREKIRNQLNIDDEIVIGHVGRFVEAKNHEFIIDIFDDFFKKNKNSVLLLIGDGNKRWKIEKKIKKLGLDDQVIFTGERTDVSELLQAMDFFVFPSLYEGLGMSAIEAQAAGLPCLVSKNVPKEVQITPNVEFYSLNYPADKWASKIKRMLFFNRKNTNLFIEKAGYDISATTKWLSEFYETLNSTY